MSRRSFIGTGASALAITSLLSHPGKSILKNNKVKAIAFDAFPIFDPRPVFNSAKDLFGDKGGEFVSQWRSTQFEYTWLRTAANRYKNFWEVTEDALEYAARKCALDISGDNKKQLMERYLHLSAWPDVLPALQTLREKGIRVCFLSNMTKEMLTRNAKNCGIEDYFEELISTDIARTYKPAPQAYELGCRILQLKKEEILFVAFAGWDACGAKWFGYPTLWMNRMNAVEEELSVQPDATSTGMAGLLDFVLNP